ncbi:hypothetical protein Acsp02_04810 [Actinoplanes sp. NBRC 103695]|nr:hypothetical protein Acsp02_04810 [Actinoplanes sp. NBRC 103695]
MEVNAVSSGKAPPERSKFGASTMLPPGGAAAVREQDAKTPGLGRPFFGGTGVAGAEVEGGTRRGWIPGAW